VTDLVAAPPTHAFPGRLIDELRCVWVPKCALPYVEVGDPHDYEHYGW
jgi:hypothetical protein